VAIPGFVNCTLASSGERVNAIIPQIPVEMDMPDPACRHQRTRIIAKDDDAQYVECLDCGEILEAGELDDGTGLDGSLSDA
jgi:hypothetical protein